MKQDIPFCSIILLVLNGKISPVINDAKVDIWARIDETNISTFSLQCQDQMVKIGPNVYHLDRLRTSLKSGYFENLFTSEDFKRSNDLVLEIPLKSSEVFPAILELIRGKELIDILDKDNYFPLLETMYQLEMEIDLQTVSTFMDEKLKPYLFQDAKICEVYKFISDNSNFEYLLESMFKHFATDLTSLKKHEILHSISFDHLIWIINKVELMNSRKRYEIIQICTKWLCHDMENRLLHMANLVINIEFAFHSSIKTNIKLSKYAPKCEVDQQMRQNIISRVLFVLLARKQLDAEKINKLKPDDNFKSFSSQDIKMFELYYSVKNDSKLQYLYEGIFKYFSDNLPTIHNHKIFLSLPYDHLIRIIKHVRESDDEKRYRIIQMYTEWLCHDMENRLPHLKNLVISAKPIFRSSIKTYKNTSRCLPRCYVDEQCKREIVSKCLFALLENDQKLNGNIFSKAIDEFCSEEDKRTLYNERSYRRFVNHNDENAKLKKFLNNSIFYDITVRVGEKSFKLHRIFLESKSDYFRDIFKAEYAEASDYCTEIPPCPSKDKEFVLNNEIEPSSFDKLLDFLYFGTDVKDVYDDSAKIGIFKAADKLGMEEACKKCKNYLTIYYTWLDSQCEAEVLKLTNGKSKYEDLYLLILSSHISNRWPEVYNVTHFCFISWTMLENMVKSPGFRLHDLDPNKILDIFSIWICHDANNRYHFLPRIAQIVNPYCGANHSEYKLNSAMESGNFSQHFIHDQLYQILSAPSYMARSENLTRNLEEIPLLIAPILDYTRNVILNVNLDIIGSYNYSESNPDHRRRSSNRNSLTSTLINDSLFTLTNFDNPPTFHVYNLFLKKCFSLSVSLKWERGRFSQHDYYTLLNCNNEIYGCSSRGQVEKYSMQFNRWTILREHDFMGRFRYTSDGVMLFRIWKSWSEYCVENYDFEKNLWICVSESGLLDPFSLFKSITRTPFTVVDNCDLAIFDFPVIRIVNHNFTRKEWHWREYKLPISQKFSSLFHRTVLAQCEDRMLLLLENKMYHYFPANESCTLKKEFPLDKANRHNDSPYMGIVAIHRPGVINKPAFTNISKPR